MAILLQWIRNRIRKNKAPVILVVGPPRVGKTFFTMSLCYMLDRNFSVSKNISFEIIDYAQAVSKNKFAFLCVDEAGIELDTYKYSDMRQRVFSHLLQTQQYLQNTLFIILPHGSDLAKCHKKYINAFLQIKGYGHYVMRYPIIPYWDLNNIEFFSKKIEEVWDFPPPPKHLQDEYRTYFESQMKEKILELEIDKLKKHLAKGLPKQPMQFQSIGGFGLATQNNSNT